jgi:hypothetical protein
MARAAAGAVGARGVAGRTQPRTTAMTLLLRQWRHRPPARGEPHAHGQRHGGTAAQDEM